MRSFSSQYQRYKASVDRQLRSCIKKSEPRSLYEPVRYILSGGGKRIRPLLVLLASEAVGGTARQAEHAAVAIEILHNFTLVHDDIMDNASSRRGRATVHTKWDTNIAILVGDELVALAYRELLKTRSPRIARIADIFTEGVVEVCEGQAYDKEYETRKHVSVDEYLLMIGKKTGKMVSVASEIGAVIGGGSADEIRALRSYGASIGRAFQIQDDLLDIMADEKEFGKPIGGDIVEGKKTFLLIEAFARSRGADKRLLRSVINRGGTSRKNIPAVREIYERCGVIQMAKQTIAKNIDGANKQLSLLAKSNARDMLYWFSHMLLNRNF
ncbi:MAG TPA: polyprenyl synthetase family protein [Bacteroidota bacterium]|nr:polyprenyl synthetase family protein [Bacteroidota bacterium]